MRQPARVPVPDVTRHGEVRRPVAGLVAERPQNDAGEVLGTLQLIETRQQLANIPFGVAGYPHLQMISKCSETQILLYFL